MADLNFQINVQGNAGEAVGSLKKQLREAQQEVVTLSDKFGATSDEAVKAAKKAAELRDRIGDAKALTDSFNPDAKFKSLTQSLAGVAGGFSAVQGAIGLFGTESKNVEKALLKVQSAMALSQGLQSIGESIDSFRNLKTVIVDVASKAFGSLKAAIVSTGIGLLVVALGLLIANFDKVKKAVLNFIPGLAQVGDFFGKLVNSVTDFIGVTSEAERQLEKLQKTTARGNETINARIKLLQAQGGKEKEIYAESKKAIENDLNVYRETLRVKGQLTEEDAKKFRDLKNEQEVLRLTEQKRIEDLNKKEAEDNRKKYEEQQRLEKEKRDKAIKDEEEYLKNQKDRADQRKKDLDKGQEDIDKVNESKKEQQKKDDADLLDRLVQRGNTSIKIAEDTIQANQDIEQSKIALAELEKQKQEEQTNLAMQSLDILSGLVDKNSAAGKAIAVSQAIINTYQGASKAIAQGGTFGPILAAATIAAGLINVKKIVSTKIPSAKGGGDVGGGSIPSISASAPVQPQLPQAQTTNLSSSTINALGNQAIKAYVVETDITTNQQRIKAIQQRARFD
jgi:hypothetical protein